MKKIAALSTLLDQGDHTEKGEVSIFKIGDKQYVAFISSVFDEELLHKSVSLKEVNQVESLLLGYLSSMLDYLEIPFQETNAIAIALDRSRIGILPNPEEYPNTYSSKMSDLEFYLESSFEDKELERSMIDKWVKLVDEVFPVKGEIIVEKDGGIPLNPENCGLVIRYEFPAEYITLCKTHKKEISEAFHHSELDYGDFYGTGCTCSQCLARQIVFNKITNRKFPWLDDILMSLEGMVAEKDYPVWYPRYDQLWVKAMELGLYTEPDGDPWNNEDNNDKSKVVIPMGFIQNPVKMLEEVLKAEQEEVKRCQIG